MKTHSQKFLKQRRFYMVLPLLVFPFIIMIFWALGGGQGTPVQAQEIRSGLNLELPGAHFGKEDELWNKVALYEQAKRDSLKHEEARKNDPYYVVGTLTGTTSTYTTPTNTDNLNTSLGSKNRYAEIDQHEVMINQKLEQLTRQLEQPDKSKSANESTSNTRSLHETNVSPMNEEVDRLEKMMELMTTSETSDPEMQHIDGMLDKILDIQHPDRARDKIRDKSLTHAEQVFPVEAVVTDDKITLLEGGAKTVMLYPGNDSLDFVPIGSSFSAERNSFFGLVNDIYASKEEGNAIEAVIHDTQTVVAGSTIRMRLLSDVFVTGQLIESGQFIYGVCAIRGERMTIDISSIRADNSLLPVSLNVYDLDGMEGIYIPGAVTREAAKQASGQSIQDVQLYSMDNSLGVQAATAGIEAAKGLFTKKARMVKVTVKAGYQIFLKDSNQLNQ